jgi:hypothetical protein
LKELAVNPSKVPSSSRVVMTVMPVANCDKAWRKWRLSKSGGSAVLVGVSMGFPESIFVIIPDFS